MRPLRAGAGDARRVDDAVARQGRGAGADAEQGRLGLLEWWRAGADGAAGGWSGCERLHAGAVRGGALGTARPTSWGFGAGAGAGAVTAGIGFAGFAEEADGALHRDVDARLHDDLQQRACLEALHLHDRLVGLDGEQDVALGDLVAFLLEPFDDGALFGHLTELGHDDGGSHGLPHRMALAAARMSLTFGRNAASRMCDCGAMPFLAPTRLTGASR